MDTPPIDKEILVIKHILTTYHHIAVYGMSINKEKPAYTVPHFLKNKQYHIIPINPYHKTILGLPCYPSLSIIDEQIDIVQVFRPSTEAIHITQEVINRNKRHKDVKVIWLQKDIINNEARRLAQQNGFIFIQDRCMYEMYNKYIRKG